MCVCVCVCVKRFAAASSLLLLFIVYIMYAYIVFLLLMMTLALKIFVCLLLFLPPLLLLLPLFQFKHMLLVWQACETCNLNQKLKHCNKITLVSFSSSSATTVLSSLHFALPCFVTIYVCVCVCRKKPLVTPKRATAQINVSTRSEFHKK